MRSTLDLLKKGKDYRKIDSMFRQDVQYEERFTKSISILFIDTSMDINE